MDLDQTAQPVGRRSLVGGVVAGTVLGAVGLGAGPARAAAGADRIALPAGLRPEGITSAGPRFFVGSLADGRIVTGDLRTGRQRTLLPGAAGRQLRGLFHDPRSGLVWAVGNVGTVGHVWAVDGLTGAVVTDLVLDVRPNPLPPGQQHLPVLPGKDEGQHLRDVLLGQDHRSVGRRGGRLAELQRGRCLSRPDTAPTRAPPAAPRRLRTASVPVHECAGVNAW